MASGTINGSCDNSRYILTCEWSSTTNTSANTSSVTAKVYLNGNGYTTSSSYWSCVINGTTVTSNKSADIGAKTLLGTRTWTVNHNSDGTASISISFSYSNGLSSSGTYTTKTGSGSATVKLDTIARASTMSLNKSSATLGSDSVTVNITRNSSSFKHKISLTLGSSTTVLTSSADTSYTFTPNISLCNQIPNATSGTGTIKVETLNGTTVIGSASKTITLNVPSSVVPSVGISVTPNNQVNGINVASKTTFTVKPTSATGSYSSTIKSYSITGGGLNSTSSSGATTGTLTAGDYTFTVKVTDSRGRTASASSKVTVHAYSAPTISARAFRCNSNGTESSSGTYIAVNFSWEITNLASNNSNVKQYFIQYKTSSASSYTTSVDWTNLSSYSGSMTKVLSQTFSTTSSYNIQLKVKDSFGTTTSTLNVSTISALLNIERNGVGVGKIHENGALDVGGAIYGSGILKLTGNGKSIQLGTGSSDVYIHNTSSGKYLQLKDTGAMSYTGNWLLAYGTALYGNISGDTANRRIAIIASHGGVDLGDTGANTAICSKAQPTWWDGSTSRQLVYSTKDSGGYPMIMSDNHGWIRTPPSGIIPNTSGTGGGRSTIGSAGWRFSTGYFNNIESASSVYSGVEGSDAGVGFVARRYLDSKQQSAKVMIINTGGGCASILHRNETGGYETQFLVQTWGSDSSGCIRANKTGVVENGTSAYKWKVVYANNGTIQTSDERFKVKQGYVNTEDCFDMVKNTNIYKYIMLGQNKEDMSKNRLGKLALNNTEEEANIHIGIMAQDLQGYECGKHILVEDEYEKEDGTKDTMLHINPLDMTMAVMGALQQEITNRENEIKQLKSDNDDLKQRVEALENLIEKIINQNEERS